MHVNVIFENAVRDAFSTFLLVAVTFAFGLVTGEAWAPFSGATTQALALRITALEVRTAELETKYSKLETELSNFFGRRMPLPFVPEPPLPMLDGGFLMEPGTTVVRPRGN